MRVPGPRGTEGRTWSVIDRWPTHPLLIKVPIIQFPACFHLSEYLSDICGEYQEGTCNFPRREAREGESDCLNSTYPCSLLIVFTFLRKLMTTRWLFSSLLIPSHSTLWTGEILIQLRLSRLLYILRCIVYNIFRWVPQSAW